MSDIDDLIIESENKIDNLSNHDFTSLTPLMIRNRCLQNKNQ